MKHRPFSSLAPNSVGFENQILIKPTGFREYDARWWFGHPSSDQPPEINLYGIQAVGAGLGTLIHELGIKPQIVVGHDFRSYSLSIKQALIVGLMEAGIEVLDIGLALSPTAYFAQFNLDCPCVAMVTASHNSNGWTGVKMGVNRPLTFGPSEMSRLKEIVLRGHSIPRTGGTYVFVQRMAKTYMKDLSLGMKIKRNLKVVVACGNGTAGAFAPHVLKAIGVDVIPLNCDLDYNFPAYNPNPEDMKMLHAMRHAVLEHGADLAIGFDGDGDRCGIVDNEGEEIFADKVGVLLARDLSAEHKNARFVVDVKSTGLYKTDPVLQRQGATTYYYKTGHSYIKARTQEVGALAGLEKSGHYFFNAPIGRGYDDGILSAILILKMLERNPNSSMADLRRSLPMTWGSPTMSPYCADEVKYEVVEQVVAEYKLMEEQQQTIMGQNITELITVNGVRIVLEDGTWGLVRASSNTPNLVVVVESPTSEKMKIGMFYEIEARLSKYKEIGEYDQKI